VLVGVELEQQLVGGILVEQLVKWVVVGRNMQDGRLHYLVRSRRLPRMLRSGWQLPPRHLRLELRSSQ
jgi:hypothetical protein